MSAVYIVRNLVSTLRLSGGTTGAVLVAPTTVTTTNATPAVNWSYTLPANSSLTAIILIDAVQTDGSNQFTRVVHASASRAGAGAILSGGPTNIIAGINTFAVTRPSITIGVSSNDIQLTITGKAATNVRWANLVLYTTNET